MNYPIAIAGCLTLLAFVAHVTGGIKQSLSIAPAKIAGSQVERGVLETLERNWVQAMCAFQLVTIDLLALSGSTNLHSRMCLHPSSPLHSQLRQSTFSGAALGWFNYSR